MTPPARARSLGYARWHAGQHGSPVRCRTARGKVSGRSLRCAAGVGGSGVWIRSSVVVWAKAARQPLPHHRCYRRSFTGRFFGGAPRAQPAAENSKSSAATPESREDRATDRAALRPESLRVELNELGDAFRAYQQCDQPDLALLAELHDRKSRAFSRWADVTGNENLRHEALRARAAAKAARQQHHRPHGQDPDD
jgi:hypothetical protein